MARPITPIVAVDAVIRFKKTSIVLIRRKNPPFKGEFALPGGFVDVGESVEDACIREAYEETNIKVKIKKLIGVFSAPNRDPRGHTISVAYLCEPLTNSEKPMAKDDAQSLKIVKLTDISSLKLAFDHKDIINASGIIKI
ncbi:MAG TPA: NUDIX hydrolase [Candidatus Nanopelagicaceae bacterium]|nr:NUDIX hydrolase [Candidatus Nanopelagicaceae bacterium]